MGKRANFARQARVSITSNASALGYSIAITATYGMLDTLLGSPAVYEIFLFLAGAVVAFTAVEAVASKGFRRRMQEDRGEVVVLAASFNLLAVAAAVGAAALTAVVLRGAVGWPLGAFFATIAFTLAEAVQMTLATRAAEPDDR